MNPHNVEKRRERWVTCHVMGVIAPITSISDSSIRALVDVVGVACPVDQALAPGAALCAAGVL
jgi:hypothetical protein